MLTPEFAQKFAAEWLAAWNAHDLPRVLSHYAQDIELTSPLIVTLAGVSSGRLKGKAAVGAYWQAALERAPQLHFELLGVLRGVDSLVIQYQGVRGVVSEVFVFDERGLVKVAAAHYG